MLKVVALLSVFLFACLTNEPAEEPTLEGLWGLKYHNGCELLIALEGDGTYKSAMSCQLVSGGVGVEYESGRYYDLDDEVKFLVYQYSCPGYAYGSAERYSYHFSKGNLVLLHRSGALTLEPVENDDISTESGAVTFGCFEEGLFTPHDVI